MTVATMLARAIMIDISQWVPFDLETAGASELFSYGPGYMRLAGFGLPDNSVGFTTNPEELIQILYDAPFYYAHNFFGFDGLVLAFYYGADWERLAEHALDTLILDRLDYPPRARDTGGSEDKYDLDHVCERRGVPGKTDSIANLAAKFGGWDQIPIDDPDFRRYLEGDVMAIRGLMPLLPRTQYAKREHELATIAGRMTLNGFRVDIPLLKERIEHGQETKQEALEILRDDYDLPLGRFEWKGRGDAREEFWRTFDSPFATKEGRQWLVEVWDAFGVRNPPLTDKGQLSTSAEALREIADSEITHPDLCRILDLMGIVTTTRTVYQTCEDHLIGDRVHPLISMSQASGRWSVKEPGLTVFGKRGGRFRERDVFIPDFLPPEDDWVLVSVDLNQVDMRGIAGHCQDPRYMALMDSPEKDPHKELAIRLFGDAGMRDKVKWIGHGENYGLGKKKLIASGFDPGVVRRYYEEMERQFPIRNSWRDNIRAEAEAGHMLDNGFGRQLRCDPARAWTQAPALMGQSAAMDIMKEGMRRTDPEVRQFFKVPVHDEVVVSCPRKDAEEVVHELSRAFTFEWKNVPIYCDVSRIGTSWGEISAK